MKNPKPIETDIEKEEKFEQEARDEDVKHKKQSEAKRIQSIIESNETEHSNKTNDTFKKAKPITNSNELKAAKKQIESLKEAMTKSISQSEMNKAVFHQSALLQEQQQLLELQRLVAAYEKKSAIK